MKEAALRGWYVELLTYAVTAPHMTRAQRGRPPRMPDILKERTRCRVDP